jgi:hypothetical protein
MADHYLGLGHGQTYSSGTFEVRPRLPLTDENIIQNLEMTASDDPMDYDAIRDERVASLQPGDSLVVAYPNKEALWIDDDDAEENNVPHNQREELWNSDGLVETYTFFTNAHDEEWAWLLDD